MQFSRARRLSSASTSYHGACLMSVCLNISSLAFENSTHFSRDLNVHLAQFPAAGGVASPLMEASFLLLVADGEPVFQQDDAGADEHPLELRARAQELRVLLLSAEAHDVFHPCPVVPTPVEQDDLPGGGQMGNVALEVPLRPLRVGGLAKGDDATATRVHRLGNALDGPALSSGVTALEQYDEFFARCLDPILHFHQFHVQFVQLGFVLLALQLAILRRLVGSFLPLLLFFPSCPRFSPSHCMIL